MNIYICFLHFKDNLTIIKLEVVYSLLMHLCCSTLQVFKIFRYCLIPRDVLLSIIHLMEKYQRHPSSAIFLSKKREEAIEARNCTNTLALFQFLYTAGVNAILSFPDNEKPKDRTDSTSVIRQIHLVKLQSYFILTTQLHLRRTSR